MSEISYKKNLIQNPVLEVGATKEIKGRQNPTMTFMSNDLVPGSNTYIEVGWIYEIPQPNPHILEHTHDFNEIVLHFGSNPDNPEDLGGEIEFIVGGETLKITKTSALFIPKGVPHGPLTWKKVVRPHIQMVVMPGVGTVQEANPAGYLAEENI